ncbi:MAG: hypothetical protein IJQ98_03300 [Oscillospiraceae bacterium]|nr:hypothetical protein [Oscillospiraceae bacterium]
MIQMGHAQYDTLFCPNVELTSLDRRTPAGPAVCEAEVGTSFVYHKVRGRHYRTKKGRAAE